MTEIQEEEDWDEKFTMACINNDMKTCEEMLNASRTNPSVHFYPHDDMCEAAHQGHFELLKWFIEIYINDDTPPNTISWTDYFLSANVDSPTKGHEDIIDYLCKRQLELIPEERKKYDRECDNGCNSELCDHFLLRPFQDIGKRKDLKITDSIIKILRKYNIDIISKDDQGPRRPDNEDDEAPRKRHCK